MARTPRAPRPNPPSWRRVWALAEGDDPAVFGRALAACAEGHREPVYACMYACARDADHARDLTHAFFASLRDGGHLPIFRAAKRARTFLQACVLQFLFNEPGHDVRRRDDGETVIALRIESGARTGPEPVDVETLKRIFNRAWAVQLFTNTFGDPEREGVDELESQLVDSMLAYVNGPPEDGMEDSQQDEKRLAGEFLLDEILKPDPADDEDDEDDSA